MINTQSRNWDAPGVMRNQAGVDPEIIDTKANPASAEVQADQIEAASPEGRPADPKLRAGGMFKWLMVSFVLITAAAIGMAIWQGPAAGIAVFVIGCGIGIVSNTEVWAAFFRARERARVDHNLPPV